MTIEDYNQYIKNYLDNDKTKSAIMLTAPWGTGKSYYIQNNLIPYINGEKGNKCVLISLYGLKGIEEISKALYLEIRLKKLIGKNEVLSAGKIIGKTILKGVSSFFGVDLSISEEDLKKLYDSIDLSGKLIIIEDLERSNIDIMQILGYVNNLVEQDGIKVLLVANENEIYEWEEVEENKNQGEEKWNRIFDEINFRQKKRKLLLTPEIKEYLKVKEKTISDTIVFDCDLISAIKNIIDSFEDKNLSALLNDKRKEGKIDLVREVISIMEKFNVYNLRSLIFACQKTIDIFSQMTNQPDVDFLRYVFLGIVAFSFRIKLNANIEWKEGINPGDLGTFKYPLYEFCYDFIKHQKLDKDALEKEEKLFIEQKLFEKQVNKVNSILSILYNFYTQDETILNSAIIQIKKLLKEDDSIPLLEYGKLINYLIAVRELINDSKDIDECKEAMIKNLEAKKATNEISNFDITFHDSFTLTEEQQKEYRPFIQEMQNILNDQKNQFIDFDYKPENTKKFVDYVLKNKDKYLSQHMFARMIKIQKLVDLLSKGTAEQIDDIRRIVNTVYSFSNISEYFVEDKPALLELKNGIQELIDGTSIKDKIVNLQLKWMISNIEDILKRLEI